MKERKKISLKRLLPWLVLAGAIALSVGIFALYGEHNLDSDMSSEFVLAQLLNEEGRFLTDNWFYSTELRVVSPVPIYQLAISLFDSWHAARTFSIAVLLVGVSACLIYAMRGAGVRDAAVYAAAAIVLPLGKAYAFVFTYGGFYTVYFMAACLMLGLVLRLPQQRRKALRLVLLAGLSVFSGLSGVRMPMVFGVPMLLACGILLFERMRVCSRLNELREQKQTTFFAGAALIIVGMGIGYLVNTHVLSEFCHFTDYGSEMVRGFSADLFVKQFDHWFQFFGFRQDVPLISIYGIADVLAILLVFAIGAALVMLLRDKTLTLEERMIPLLSACALVVGVIANGLTERIVSAYAVSYYIVGVLLGVVSLFMFVSRVKVNMPALRTVLLLGLVCVFVLEARSYLGMGYKRTEQPYEEAADYLVENGYTTGYATFWYANVLTEAADGKLDLYTYDSFEDDTMLPWLQRVEHSEKTPEGPVFVYVDGMDFADLNWNVPCAQEDHLAFTTSNGKIYVYDSAEEVEAIQRAYAAAHDR